MEKLVTEIHLSIMDFVLVIVFYANDFSVIMHNFSMDVVVSVCNMDYVVVVFYAGASEEMEQLALIWASSVSAVVVFIYFLELCKKERLNVKTFF